MIHTLIGSIEVAQYITSYSVENPPVYGGNSFTDISGTEVQDKLGDKIILHIAMHMPTPIAQQIATLLQQDSISVTYTTPALACNNFKKTAYSADCVDADPEEDNYSDVDGIMWDIDVTLESLDYAASGSDSL